MFFAILSRRWSEKVSTGCISRALPRLIGRGVRMSKNPTSERVCCELAPEEERRLQQAREETAAKRAEIVAERKLRKQARDAMQREQCGSPKMTPRCVRVDVRWQFRTGLGTHATCREP